jgi:hypothetical protein
MACETTTEKYTQVVQKLIAIDPVKYSEFDNIAKFLIKSVLTPEQKTLSLHHIAHIFKSLSSLAPEIYSIGNAHLVSEGVVNIGEPDVYMEAIGSIYDVKPDKIVSFKKITDAISAMGNSKNIPVTDDLIGANGALGLMNQYFNSAEFNSREERAELLKQAFDMLEQEIVNMGDLLPASNKMALRSQIAKAKKSLESTSDYINRDDLAPLEGYDSYMVVLADGSIVEAQLGENGKFQYIWSNNTGEVSDIQEEIVYSKKLANFPASTRQSIKQTFKADTIASSFSIRAVNPDDQAAIDKVINSSASPQSKMEIILVVNSGMADFRVEALQAKASQDPKLASLANRNHETYETAGQIKALQATPDATIMTVARPKAGEQPFTLMGKIKGTDQMFYLYGLDNYAFVKSDNSTELVDFSNEGHLALVKKLADKWGNNWVSEDLTQEDLDQLKASYLRHKEFMAEMRPLAQEGFATDFNMDVTEEFFNKYRIGRADNNKTSENLDQALNRDRSISKSLTVVTVVDGEVVETEQNVKVPFFFSRTSSTEMDLKDFVQHQFLANNQKIAVNTPTGVKYISERDYATQVLGINHSVIAQSVTTGLTNGKDLGQKNILIQFNKDGSFGYRIVEPMRPFENEMQFGMFLANMVNVIDSGLTNMESTVKSFDKEGFTFRFYNNTKGQTRLKVNFAAGAMINGKRSLQIELRPFGNTGAYDFIVGSSQSRQAFNFPLNESLIKDLNSKIKALSNGSKSLRAAHPGVFGISDTESLKGTIEFFQKLDALVGLGNVSPEVQALVDEIRKAEQLFSNHIMDTVIGENASALIAKTAAYPQFMDAFREDFTRNGVFMPNYLVGQDTEDNTWHARIQLGNANSHFNNSFTRKARNYKLLTFDKKEAQILPNEADNSKRLTANPATNGVVDISVEEVVEEEVTPEEVGTGTTSVDDTDEYIPDMFSLLGADAAFETETKEERLTTTQWLADALPQLGLSTEDVADMIDLAKIDGRVLGAMKDKMIYLSNSMLSKGVVYHEAFHGVFRHLMTSTERDALINKVTFMAMHQSKFTDAALEAFARDRNLLYNKSEMARLQAEEILADGFQKHMNEGKKSTGIVAAFHKILRKLLEFFNMHSKLIDHTYADISDGRFSQRVAQSGMFQDQVAYELIPGLKEYYMDDAFVTPRARNGALSTYDQNQLISTVTAYLLNDFAKEDFDTKFDRNARKVLDEVYNIEKLVALSPKNRKGITEKYNPLISNYRFMLGARRPRTEGETLIEGETIYEVNISGNKSYDKKILSVAVVDGEVDNNLGQVSYDALKRMVKKQIDKTKDLYQELEDSAINLSNITGDKITDQDDVKSDIQEGGSFDKDNNEHNPMDAMPAVVRRLLSLVRSTSYDAQFNIEIPTMVDAETLYGALIKTSADIAPEHIVNNIKVVGQTLEKDGYEISRDYIALYNEISSKTIMNEDGQPLVNKQLFRSMVDALHLASVEFMTMHVQSKYEYIPEAKVSIDETIGYTIKDKIQYEDISKKKKDLIASMITTHTGEGRTPAYREALKEAIRLSTLILIEPDLLSDIKSTSVKLDTLTNDIHTAFKTLGMVFPKSLISLSLMAINTVDKKQKTVLDDEGNYHQLHYDIHAGFIADKSYLELDFFTDVKYILGLLTGAEALSNNQFANLMDESNLEVMLANPKKYTNINRFNIIVGKAMSYVVKYDPSELPGVVKDSEGKTRYRYAKYSPATIIAQKIRREGLDAALSDDPHYLHSLKNFFADNYFFAEMLAGDDSLKVDMMKLFMNNFKVQMFGGVTQSINGEFQKGNSFKNIDEKSLYALGIMSFLSRTNYSSFKNVVLEDGTRDVKATTISTYARSFSQLESSDTNLLVTAIYSPYANSKGVSKDKEGRLKIVANMEAVVKQEYNRIQREWSSRAADKEAYDSGKKGRLMANYNGVIDENDKTKADVENKKLRGHKFSKFADFFNSEKGADLSEALINIAKAEGEDAIAYQDIAADLKKQLLDALNVYAQDQLDKHVQRLVDIEVISKVEEPRISMASGTAKTLETAPNTFYISSAIAKQLKVAGQLPVAINDMYSKSPNNFDLSGNVVTGKADIIGLVQDSFFNNWANAMSVNDILDGDMAMNVKDQVDYFKRQKKFLAAGSTMKEGFHRVAYFNALTIYIDTKNPQYGPYKTFEDIESDTRIPTDALRAEIQENWKNKNNHYESFDGQSITSLMHQMDMHESMGRLSEGIIDIMIAKHYRELSQKELAEMKANKVVNNPKKSVTADRNVYHKLSETYIDRLQVSELLLNGKTKKEVEETLHGLYAEVYSLRALRQEAHKAGEFGMISDLDARIKVAIQLAHGYFAPLNHRKEQHAILNSMEYHQVDQVMDTTASKNATILPLDIEASKLAIGEYLNLPLASQDLDNRFKFLQVETSGVKDKVKMSVQSKTLLPADLARLFEIATAGGNELSASEKASVDQVADTLVKYQDSLRKISESNMAALKTVMRKGADFDMGLVYKLIYENLAAQGAPSPTLDLFSRDASGKPVHSPNLPAIRNMLEYYFFSQYSKHVTDEKGAGFKNIHISSYGYDVVEEIATGKIITTDTIRKDPRKYEDKALYKARPLGVSVEDELGKDGLPTGRKIYFMETIMPMPGDFSNPQQREFYMKYLTKAFGVRIPSEDKRSMVAIKVVDFLDSSNSNGIVMPQMVHLLAGSDFDVDALYGQVYAHYVNAAGVAVLYGDYERYGSKATGEFVEFVHYMGKDMDLKELITIQKKKLLEQEDYTPSQNALDIVLDMGFEKEDIIQNMNLKELQDTYSDLQTDYKAAQVLSNSVGEEFAAAKDFAIKNPQDKEASKERKRLGAYINEVNTNTERLREEKREIYPEITRAAQFKRAVLKIEATLLVLQAYNLPVSQAKFEANPDYNLSVRPKYQNENLAAKIGIMSNEAVFNHLYIHEHASPERFAAILDAKGIDIKKFGSGYNHLTSDGMIKTKVTNSMNKDGISISANINKFMSMASQYDLKLNKKNVVWSYVKKTQVEGEAPEYEIVSRDSFGGMNDESTRAIALVGNMLGMFADAAKDPFPAALMLNEVNTTTILSMLGVGVEPDMAMSFNFIPEIRNAIARVQQSKAALTKGVTNEMGFLGTEINAELKEIVTADVLDELFKKGVILPGSYGSKLLLNKERILLEHTAKKLDAKAIEANVLTTNQIGFTVSAVITSGKKGSEVISQDGLSEEATKAILMTYYNEQAAQTWKIRDAGSINNLFKKLNPSFITFDKLRQNVNDMRYAAAGVGESIFTQESLAPMFAKNQPWGVLADALDDLNDQAAKIFLERTESFKPITNAFETVFTDKANIAKVITSFVALYKYKSTMPGSRTSTNKVLAERFAQDDANLLEAFTPEYWFNNTLAEELNTMQQKYPTNAFLKLIRPQSEKTKAVYGDDTPATEESLRILGKVKINGAAADAITDDARLLVSKEPIFMKKLFYHELAKTGMHYKAGSFLQYMPSEYTAPLSKYIEGFVDVLRDSHKDRKGMIDKLATYMGITDTDVEERNRKVYGFFDALFVQMGHAAVKEVGNKKIVMPRAVSFSQDAKWGRNFMGLFEFDEETPANGIDFTAAEISVIETKRLAIAAEHLSDIVGQEVDPKLNKFQLSSVINKEAVPSITLNFNLKLENALSESVLDAVAKTLGLGYDQETGDRIFPVLLKVGTNNYILQGVDLDMDNNSFGKTVVRAISYNGSISLSGTTAKYKLLPAALSSGTLSPIGFSAKASKMYMDYINKAAILPFKEGYVPIERQAPKKVLAPEVVEAMPETANFVEEAWDIFYEDSSKQLSKEAYKKTAMDMYVQLRGTFTKIEQFLDIIKCL